MNRDKDLSRLFAKGQQLETSLSSSGILSKDSGLHLMSYKVSVGGKSTIIDNIAVYGSTVLVLEAKNYTMLQGSADQPFWRGKGVKRHFTVPNPLKQNQYHVRLLDNFILSKGLRRGQFTIKHYIIVPDSCHVDVCEEVRENLMYETELEKLKSKMAFYNPVIDERLYKIIKEGLF